MTRCAGTGLTRPGAWSFFILYTRTVYSVSLSSSSSSSQFQEDAKDGSVSECTWTLRALEALRNALYKFKTYLLTYLLAAAASMPAFAALKFYHPASRAILVLLLTVSLSFLYTV